MPLLNDFWVLRSQTAAKELARANSDTFLPRITISLSSHASQFSFLKVFLISLCFSLPLPHATFTLLEGKVPEAQEDPESHNCAGCCRRCPARRRLP